MTDTIKKILPLQVLDSRGNPTVSVMLTTSSGISVRAAVPSGASTGTHEALELRDGDPSHFAGQGVEKAIENINTVIAPALYNQPVDAQQKLDDQMREMDGTPNKSRLGANAILGVSLALIKAAAAVQNVPLYRYLAPQQTDFTLPLPLFNIINGGRHADNKLSIQEYKLIPIGAKSFAEAMEMGSEVFHVLQKTLHAAGYSVTVGDEGGFAPLFTDNEQGMQYIVQAMHDAGYQPGKDLAIGLDVAASEFYEKEKYALELEGKALSRGELLSLYERWFSLYPIVSLEDGLHEDDFSGWQEMTTRFGSTQQIMGDDFLVTNPERLRQAIEMRACNAVLIKPNQIGTVSEVLEVVRLAKAAGFGTVISHRSGETEDTTIADLAVGLDLRQIKSGSLSRSERLAKYNRLLEIEQELGTAAHFTPVLPKK